MRPESVRPAEWEIAQTASVPLFEKVLTLLSRDVNLPPHRGTSRPSPITSRSHARCVPCRSGTSS